MSGDGQPPRRPGAVRRYRSQLSRVALGPVDRLQALSGRLRHRLRGGSLPAPVFIVGTGRSGTHWVAGMLGAHPQLHVWVERPGYFQMSSAMAIDPSRRDTLFPRLAQRYSDEMARVAPRHFADKSHTNIWIAERLAERFPSAVFVGVSRDVYGTVNSMLRHEGVMKWIEGWLAYPMPNRFLGITPADVATYGELPLAAKCALRWRSHEQRLAELHSVLGDRMLRWRYDELQRDPGPLLAQLEERLGLSEPFPPPSVKRESLDRWQTELQPDEVSAISSTINEEP